MHLLAQRGTILQELAHVGIRHGRDAGRQSALSALGHGVSLAEAAAIWNRIGGRHCRNAARRILANSRLTPNGAPTAGVPLRPAIQNWKYCGRLVLGMERTC